MLTNIHQLHATGAHRIRQIKLIQIFTFGLFAVVLLLTLSLLPQTSCQYQDKQYRWENGGLDKNYGMGTHAVDPILREPPFYPWFQHTAGLEQHWNFSAFWEKVNTHIPSPERHGQLYAVRSGKLYRKVQKKSKQDEAQGRRLHFEQMTSFSLYMAKNAFVKQDNNQTTPWGPGLQQPFGDGNEPFPFFFNWGDFHNCYGKTYPLFTLATYPSEREGESCIPIGIPTYAQWNANKQYGYPDEWSGILQQRQQEYPWESKINKAIWRGSTTGLRERYPYWRDLPRTKLVQYSLDKPNLIDAGFVKVSQRSSLEAEEILASGVMKERMPMEQFQSYRAIIDIDGNSWSSRFANLLCMNSVIIKVDPEWVDYFHAELQPWVHYVPVYRNMSNLVDVVEQVLQDDPENQRQMQSIVRNANEFCRSKMTSSQMSLDMVLILISYLEILKKEDSSSGDFTRWKEMWSADWPASEWEEVRFLNRLEK